MPGVFAQGSRDAGGKAEAELLHIPETFLPPENSELTDLTRAAIFLGEKVLLEPGFPEINIRRFGSKSVRYDNAVMKVPFVRSEEQAAGLTGFERWIYGLQRGLGERTGTDTRAGEFPLDSPAAGTGLKDAVLIRGDLGRGEGARINPVGVYLDLEPGRARLTVVNHLTNRVLFQRAVEGFDGDPAALAAEAREAVSRHDFSADLKALPRATPEEKAKWSATWAFKPAGKGEVRADAKAVAAEWKGFPVPLKVQVFPSYFAWDRGSDGDQVFLDVDAGTMRANGHRPILIRNRGGVRIWIEERDLLKAGCAFPAFATGKSRSIGGIEGVASGVRVTNVSNGYEIFIPPAFARGPEEPRLRPITLDLSAIGLPSIRHTFYQEVLPQSGQYDAYAVYADGGRAVVDPNRERIGAVGAGAAEVERAFGQEPGSVVKRLYVPDTMDKNLSVSDPSRIDIYDESLELDSSSLRIFGRHEALHSYDFSYRISEDKVFTRIYEGLRGGDGRFFDFINEKHFYGGGFGGHAQDNALELFATLGNTVYHPEVVSKVQDAPREIREQYVEALRTLRLAVTYAIGRREFLDPINSGVAPRSRRQGPVPLAARIDAVLRELDPGAVPGASPRD